MAQVVTITPADAKAYLGGNTNNRTINERAVARYATAMQRGEWLVGNDAICIAEDGTLLNGQHRLSAVILSGAPQQFLVRENVNKDDLKAMDQGNKRLGSDIATLLGHKMSKGQAKALRLLGTDWTFTATIATPSVDTLITLDNEWAPFLENASKLISSAKRNSGIPMAAAAEALCWRHLDGRQQMIADFFSIMWDNVPAADRATDGRHTDFIPCQFHRYANDLAKEGRQLRTFVQYKRVLVGLHAYINNVSLTKSRNLDIDNLVVPAVNPFRA